MCPPGRLEGMTTFANSVYQYIRSGVQTLGEAHTVYRQYDFSEDINSSRHIEEDQNPYLSSSEGKMSPSKAPIPTDKAN
jgi:hypothetical protein